MNLVVDLSFIVFNYSLQTIENKIRGGSNEGYTGPARKIGTYNLSMYKYDQQNPELSKEYVITTIYQMLRNKS